MKDNIRRGDVFFVNFGKTVGSIQGRVRPVIVLQNDIGNKHSPTIIVATITARTICSAHELIKFIICTSSHYLIFLQLK